MAALGLKWLLSHARGYIELGLLKEAAAELEQIPPADRARTEVLALRGIVLQETKAWKELQQVAEELVRRHPETADWWIMSAYATRRAKSLIAAERILEEAKAQHPKNPTIQFNLGCYACQRGDLITAQTYVKTAIALDAHFQSLAATDPDLGPLRKQSLI